MLRVLMVLEDYGELMFLQTVLKKMGFDVDSIQNPRKFNDALLTMNPDLLVMTAFGKSINGSEMNRHIRRVRGTPKTILLRNPGMIHDPDEGNVAGWLDIPVGAVDLLNKIAEVTGLNPAVLQDKFQKLRLSEAEGDDGARILKPIEGSDVPTLERHTVSGGNFEPRPESHNVRGEMPNHGVGLATATPDSVIPTPPPMITLDVPERDFPANAPTSGLQTSSIATEERRARYKKFLDEPSPEQSGFTIKEVQEKVRDLRRDEDVSKLADLEKERKAFVEQLFKKKA